MSDYERVARCLELAETALDWIVNPASEAPPEVIVGELRDELAQFELDLRCADLLAAAQEGKA